MKALRYLDKYLRKYRLKLFAGIIITVISRIFSLFAPRLIGNSLTTVEKFLSENQTTLEEVKQILLINILIIIGASILSAFFTFLMRQMIINVSRFIEYDLKNEIFQHYQILDQTFYKNNRTGDLMNRISEDVSKVRLYVGPALMYGINTITLFLIVISFMINIAPELTIYVLLPLPFLSYLIYKLSRIINQRSTKAVPLHQHTVGQIVIRLGVTPPSGQRRRRVRWAAVRVDGAVAPRLDLVAALGGADHMLQAARRPARLEEAFPWRQGTVRDSHDARLFVSRAA